MKNVLTIKEIMEQYGVSKRTAIRWAKTVGTVPRVDNGKIYVSKEALERYMKGV